jgi:hypothetical protein
MVLSKLDNKISYLENKTIDENDKGRDVTMYQLELFNIKVVIALGEIKFTYIDNNILFAPVYLVVNETNKIYQVGVYEFSSQELENLKDDEGDMDISMMDGPLLFSFIDKAYIQKCMRNEKLVPDYDSGDEDSDEDSDEEETDKKGSDEEEELLGLSDDEDEKDEKDEEGGESKKQKKTKNPPPLLVELEISTLEDDDDFLLQGETSKDDKKVRKTYKTPGKSESQWVQHFMTNNNYNIINKPSDGHCFFHVVQDAFKSVNIDASIKKVREKLVERVDDIVFRDFIERYDMIHKEIKTLLENIPKEKKLKAALAKKYNKLARESKEEKDRDKRNIKKDEAKEVRSKHIEKGKVIERMKRELSESKINMKDVKWLKNIKTLDQLRSKMKTCDYWADQWAISTLEIILNTKFIILSSDNYKRGQYNRVLSCGDFVHPEVEKKTFFKPKFYIIFEHTGNHYKLIGYKDKEIYRFHEIPYGMKTKIVERCMKSKGKSLYNYIPKFAKLIGETIEIPQSQPQPESKMDEGKLDNVLNEDKAPEDLPNPEMIPTPSPQDKDLYDEDIQFIFWSGSKDTKPGKGKNEKITDEKKSAYDELGQIKDWRKVLSNFYTKEKVDGEVQPLFELDGLKWASVEHYYHANKFKKNNLEYYKSFSIDSDSVIMDDAISALGAGGKSGVVRKKIKGEKKKEIIFKRPKEVVMDSDFFDGKNREIVMERAQRAKYEQDDFCRRVLLATKDAKLLHYVIRSPVKVTFYDTMRIRKSLKGK